MTALLTPFISFIQKQMNDTRFNIVITPNWNSEAQDYRVKIREHLATIDASYFNPVQLVQLYDLNQRPQAADGCVSISHCRAVGGYSYSKHPHGFDIEEIKRISDPIILRTSSDEEREKAPHIKFLWGAKEAAFKAIADSNPTQQLIITDLVCDNWQQQQSPDFDIWSYQISSQKLVKPNHNLGYVFSTPTLLLAIYFK